MTSSWTEVGSGEQQGVPLSKARNQELTSYYAVNHWRILIRKVTLPKLHVRKVTLTTTQKGLRARQPAGEDEGRNQGDAQKDAWWSRSGMRNWNSHGHSTMALGDTAQGHYVRKEKP